MGTSGDISQAAASNANLQSQLAASQQQAKNEDPDGIFELFTECFNYVASFVGKVTPGPLKVSGLLSTGLDAHAKVDAAAPVKAGSPVKPGGEGGAQGGVAAKGMSKILNFKNLLAGLSAPTIEALQAIGETVHNVSTGDLFTFVPLPTGGMGRSSGIDYESL